MKHTPLPGKTGQRLFLLSSTNRECRCWPPCGPLWRVSPQGGETDPFQARKSQIRPCVGKVEKSPNIASKEGVKKKQVKGCGSVNRPTPGSQRPAEPVATGFLPGVNSPVFLGQFWGLGVKPWVRSWEKPGVPGKNRGSGCGFGPKSEGEKAYDRTEIPCARKAQICLVDQQRYHRPGEEILQRRQLFQRQRVHRKGDFILPGGTCPARKIRTTSPKLSPPL